MTGSTRAVERDESDLGPAYGGGQRLSDLLRRQARCYPAEPACIVLDRSGKLCVFGNAGRR